MDRKLKLSGVSLMPENASCEHCLEELVLRLSSEQGIDRVHRDRAERLCLHYDDTVWQQENLARTARLHGAEVQRHYRRRLWRVSGLSCGDCVRTVREGLMALPGVLEAEGHLATGQVAVEFQESVSEEMLRERLAQIGYPVEEVEADEAETTVARWRRRLLSREWRPLMLGTLTALLAVLLSFTAVPGWIIDTGFVLAIISGAWDIGPGGLRQLITARRLTVDLLMTIAAVGALLLGEFAEGAAVVLLFVLGETLEGVTMERARRSIRSLMALTPDEASRLQADGTTQRVPVEQISVGDHLLVRPGERVPMDGIVVAGTSSVDQSPITGESIPVARDVGDELFAGSINGRGALEVRVTRSARDNLLARIISLVEQTQGRRAPAQRFVDRFAAWYTPAVLVGAVTVALLSPFLLGWAWSTSIHRALVLLVISCPCALVISTPVSIISAVSNAAHRGVLIKGGAYLEALGTVRVMALDKTGTLTLGQPVVTDVVPLDGISEETLLVTAAAIERRSEHPLAEAIVRAGEDRSLPPLSCTAFEALPGRGATGQVDGVTVRVGNRSLVETLNERAHRQIDQLESAGKTVVVVEREGKVAGFVAVADQVRPGAREAIARLHELGIGKIVMLTGDNERTARAIASQLGLDDVRAGLLPDEKVQAVEALRAEWGTVAMVGDGVNDAPALAAATVGIAMGAAGTDQALEVADVALMADDLSKLAFAMELSRTARQTIQRNIFFSLAVKLLFVLLAIPGLVTLWMAVFADDGASLLVTGNGLRLLRWDDRGSP